jgi:hypothetical protein
MCCLGVNPICPFSVDPRSGIDFFLMIPGPQRLANMTTRPPTSKASCNFPIRSFVLFDVDIVDTDSENRSCIAPQPSEDEGS